MGLVFFRFCRVADQYCTAPAGFDKLPANRRLDMQRVDIAVIAEAFDAYLDSVAQDGCWYMLTRDGVDCAILRPYQATDPAGHDVPPG